MLNNNNKKLHFPAKFIKRDKITHVYETRRQFYYVTESFFFFRANENFIRKNPQIEKEVFLLTSVFFIFQWNNFSIFFSKNICFNIIPNSTNFIIKQFKLINFILSCIKIMSMMIDQPFFPKLLFLRKLQHFKIKWYSDDLLFCENLFFST